MQQTTTDLLEEIISNQDEIIDEKKLEILEKKIESSYKVYNYRYVNILIYIAGML